MDPYTFCEALGPDWGNKVLRAHWDAWYTEDHIRALAERKVEIARLPIGDWTLDPYGPYIGCTEGSVEKIQWMLDTCAKYNISVWLDVHTGKGGQNGFDNGGQAIRIEWDKSGINYTHWAILDTAWAVKRNQFETYDIDFQNVQRTIKVAEDLLKKWGSHSALYAFEPINEPREVPKGVLEDMYRKVRKLVQRYAPQAYFVFHDMFKFDATHWNKLFDADDLDKVAIDTHQYQAFKL
jgi:glucan 1,3-beta-glucosidase